MKLQLVSKNNVGVALTLLLVILLSQSNSLNFFINTYLGRTLLIALLLVVSYCNKILGVVFVLLIIVAFNTSSYGLYEGLTNPTTPPSNQTNGGSTSSPSPSSPSTKTNPSSSSSPSTKTNPSSSSGPSTTTNPSSSNGVSTTIPSTSGASNPSSTLPPVLNNAPASVAGAFGAAAAPAPPATPATPATTTTTNPTTNSLVNEGFSLIDTENNMKRGKQSNSINVYTNNRSAENVQPSDESVFSGLYSSL